MAVQRDDEWENPQIVCVKECERTPATAEVKVRPIVRAKIEALMKKYTSREWLSYLIQKIDCDDPYLVEDTVVPEQVATSGSVDDIVIQEGLVPEGYKMIGVMHSHHNMNIGFSGTDDNWINQNHDISILVSHKEISGQVRFNTPCGAKKIVKCKVIVKHDLNFDADAWVEEVDKNIKAYRAPVTNFSGGQWDGYEDGVYYHGGHGMTPNRGGGNGHGNGFRGGRSSYFPAQGGTISRDAVNRKTEDLFAGIDKEFTLEQELKAAFGDDQEGKALAALQNQAIQNADDDGWDTAESQIVKGIDEVESKLNSDDGPAAGPDN
jgi:hypothetical protein